MTLADHVKAGICQFLSEVASGLLTAQNVAPQTLRQFHREKQEQMNAWKASRQCIVPKCRNRSVKKSHTLQKSGALTRVSEKNIVLTPEIRPAEFRLQMRPINIASASTFPGFCLEHETLFHKFEREKKLIDGIDYTLQMYRAICRKIHRFSNEIKFYKENHDEWHEAYYEYLAIEIARRINDAGVNTDKEDVRSMLRSICKKDTLDFLTASRQSDLNTLQETFLPLAEDIIFGVRRGGAPIFVLSIPFEVPVTLSGLDFPIVNLNGEMRRLINVINVIPEQGRTDIILFYSLNDERFMNDYIQAVGGQLPALSMIEGAMINSTDHWFIRHSVWKNIPDKRKSLILRDIYFRDASALEFSMYSIFDSVRRRLIEAFETSTPLAHREPYERAYIAWEKGKLE